MPTLISIAVESPKRYIGLDAEGQVWRGWLSEDAGRLDPLVIEWEPVAGDFPDSSEPAKMWPKGDQSK